MEEMVDHLYYTFISNFIIFPVVNVYHLLISFIRSFIQHLLRCSDVLENNIDS